MNRIIRITVFVSILFAVSSYGAFAEYIYLKDGQIVQGTIVSEDATGYSIKTRYQTKWIPRNDVIRIMYGERKLEPISLLMNDGSTINGFLVDQDAEKVIMRKKEDSPEETTVLKSTIRQMSGSEIVPLDPSIFVRAGVFAPLNSRGSKLKPAFCFFAGSDITFQWIKNIRLLAEAGYARNKSAHSGLYMQFVPVQASAIYDIRVAGNFHIMPKISGGVSIVDFNDGEGTKERSVAGMGGAGAGFVYEISERHLYAGLWGDYFVMRDKSALLHGYSATGGVSYRF